jgi:hypothetical protein
VALVLTKRDLEIFDTLTMRVRVLSLAQVARTWWPEAKEQTRVAENRLRILAAENLLHIERAPAHPEIQIEAPVAIWNLGQPEPDFGAVCYQLQSRWHQHPVLTPCVSASRTAADRFGGYGGRPPRSVERTHDIHMAQVFLRFRDRQPETVADWVFEEQVKSERKLAGRRSAPSQPGEKLPDAFLRSQSGTRVIEFGGAYGKDKLIAFHGYCKEHSFPYEIW